MRLLTNILLRSSVQLFNKQFLNVNSSRFCLQTPRKVFISSHTPEDVGEHIGVSTNQSLNEIKNEAENSSEEKKVVKLRGLPWSATEEDIVKFLGGITITQGSDGVHLALDHLGRPNGIAYVELENAEDFTKAEKKHREYIKDRYVEVFEATQAEYEYVISRKDPQPNPGDKCCVRLRGLPYKSTSQDVTDFLNGLEIVPDGMVMTDGYQGPQAYVQFVDEEVAQKALAKNRETIGDRYIETFPSSLNEIRMAMKYRFRNSSRKPTNAFTERGFEKKDNLDEYYSDFSDSPWENKSGRTFESPKYMNNFNSRSSSHQVTGHCVNMKGLPFNATEYEIEEFFKPLKPVKINIKMNQTNRPSGLADVEFATHDEALQAMKKDRENIQHRYIELHLRSKP